MKTLTLLLGTIFCLNAFAQEETKEEPKSDREFYWAGTLGYNTQGTVNSNIDFSVGTASSGGKYDSTAQGGGNLGIEFGQKRDWGPSYSAGINYDLQRSIDKGKFKLTVGTFDTNDRSSFTSMQAYFNAVFYFGKPYLLFGSNLSSLTFNASTSTKSNEGGLGYQGGFGYFFNKKMAIEVTYRKLTGSAKEANSTLQIKYDYIEFVDTQIKFKYLF